MNYRSKRKNKFILWCIMAVAAIVLAFSMVLVAKALESNEGYRTINVLETGGTVSVVKDGIEYKAYSGMLLQEGHELVVAGNSYARLVLDDDKYIKVESGSRVVFETLGLLGSGKTGIRLERGSLTAEVVNPLTEGEEFVVNTPNAVLAVRGTFFRVDLTMDKKGEVLANVMTYGGKVATKRVFPSGETEEEETLVEAGYKTAINMDATDTVYVVQKASEVENDASSADETVVPIHREEISDDDLVDIYFAAENGHELFVTMEEVKEDIENREISLEDKVSVYKLAEEALKQENAAINADGMETIALDQIAFADDSKPLSIVAEDKVIIGDATLSQAETEEPIVQQMATLTDGLGETVVSVHAHQEVTTTLDATCTKSGKTVVSCYECGETISETSIPAIGHSEKIALTEATCEQAGSRVSSCEVCGEGLSNISFAALGHTMQTQVTETTCEEDGYSIATCSVCGVVERKDGTKATGHTKVTESSGASCTSDGFKKTYCSTCGEVLSDTKLSASGHTMQIQVTEATCEEDGYSIATCSVCGVVERQAGDAATGHAEVTERVDATCTSDGYEKTYCSTCGEVLSETVLPMGDHTPQFVGTMNFHSECSVCGITLVTVHTYEEEVTLEATCSNVGEKTYRCECGYTYTEEIPTIEHNYTSSEVTNEPTCTAVGEMTYTCTCGDSYTEEIPIEEHDYAEVINDPTDGSNGSKYDSCQGCGATANAEMILAISDINFPDAAFCAFVESSYNKDGRVGLTEAEIAEVTTMTIGPDVAAVNLVGISYFSALETLTVESTSLEELDVSMNPTLSTLNVMDATGLTMLNCSNTVIELLATTNLPELESILATNCTKLNTITAGGCDALVSLDASGCTLLREVDLAADTLLATLKLTGNTALELLDLNTCIALTSLDVSFADKLNYLTVTYCWEMTSLNISNTDVTELDLTDVTKLQELNVSRTKLSMLNVDGFSSLTRIDAVNCESMLTISAQECSNLSYVDASGSSLNGAWFTDSANLVTLNLSNSRALSQVNIQNCTSLGVLDVTDCGSAFGNCIINAKGSNITTQNMITGFDSSYMTYRTDQ